MRHGPPGRGADEKPKNVKSSMLELLRYLKPWYKPIVISLIFSLVGTLLTIIAPDIPAEHLLRVPHASGYYTSIWDGPRM